MSKWFQILLIIVLIGLVLRAYKITELSLYGDELTMVYDTYSILKTGMDQTGEVLPLTFDMGAGRPGGYIYASLPFVFLFGPTELGVRSLSLLSGLGIIVLIYLLGKKLFNEKIGLIASGILAFSPWDIALSRGGFEAHFALFLALLGIFTFIKASEKPWLYLLSALSFGLTIHTYPTYKLVLPFLLTILFLYQGKKFLEKKSLIKVLISGVFLAFFIILAFFQTLNSGSENRFLTINAFSQNELRESLIQKVNEERTLDTLPPFLSKIFHNQQDEYFFILGESYLKNFSLDFLFLHGDGNPRHNMATMGELYLIEIIFIFLGIIYLWKNEKKRILTLLLTWLFIAPLATTLLLETHALRSAFMLPPLVLLSAVGFFYLWTITKKGPFKLIRVAMVLIFILQFLVFLDRIYFLSPNRLARFWSYPAKLAVETVLKNKQTFQYIILSDRVDNLEYAFPVYAKIDPEIVIDQNKNRTELLGFRLKKFDNVYIGNVHPTELENLSEKLNSPLLYIGPAEEVLGDFQTLPGKDGLNALVVKEITR